jgi:peroxiredoxin
MQRRVLAPLTVLAAVCLAWSGSASADEVAAKIGAPAPAFTLEDQAGNKVSLSDYAGKVVVLEWVNPECPFVKRHYKAQTMTKLAQKYKAQDVVWLAINTTSSTDKAHDAEWISKHSLGYPILDDRSGQVGKLYGAKTTPHMYIIDQKGTLVYVGGIDDDPSGSNGSPVNYVEKALDEVLSGKPVSSPETKPYGCSVKYAA